MSGIGRVLQLTLQAAHNEAVARRHAYLTVEHLLYAVLFSDEGLDILGQSGADVNALQRALEKFFDEDLERVPGNEPVDTLQTLAFHRVVQHALDHAESAEKDEVEIADLVVSLFQEPDSHALNLLRGQEVSRLDVMRYIAHGESKAGATGRSGEPGSSSVGADGETG
ncbi:MAG: ATP-dependent Clp protease ATP-binding subunit ClpA, partial [Myxococcota bacterium]|nr:ATP-dependent Clp protease ATP-binding subunit ClpA [Myxococcota bacterium]